MKNKVELKAALDALQVRKPLRLPSAAPTFVAPTFVAPTPVDQKTGVSLATPAVKGTPAITSTSAEKHTQVSVSTQEDIQTPIGNVAQTADQTQVEKTAPASSATSRRATEQDSSVLLEAQAEDKLERGYTRLPNTVLMRLSSGDLTRNEIKLVLLIARFTISFQRRLAPLSKSVLARRSGLREPAVLEALSGLLAKGVIEKRQGDQNRPNFLGLILPDDWDDLIRSPGQTEKKTGATNSAPTENATPVINSNPAGTEKPTETGTGNATHFKDKEIYSNKNSFSQLPEKLRVYFEELKPIRKRESEWNFFEELHRDYSTADIADCLTFVQTRGIGPNDATQPCHSPMAFLSKAIGEILPHIVGQRKKAQERIKREQQEADAAQIRAEEEAREAKEWALKEREFEKTYPSAEQQLQAMHALLKNQPFQPNTHVGRLLAISRWWDQSKNRT